VKEELKALSGNEHPKNPPKPDEIV